MAKRKSQTVEKGIFYQYVPGDPQERKYYYVRLNGSRVYCGEGDEGYQKAKLARRELEQEKALHQMDALGLEDRAEKIRKQKKARSQFKTVTDLSNWYFSLHSIQSQASYTRKTHSARHILAFYGKMRLEDVDADSTEEYREYRKGFGAADATVDLDLAVLRAMYFLARKRKKIPAEYMPGEFVQVRATNPRPLITDEQYNLLVENTGQDFADVITCGWESAMRSGEIANLRAYQVHLNATVSEVPPVRADYIDLGIFDTKTKAQRTVPVSAELKEVLARRVEGLEPEDYVFTKEDGKPWNSNAIATRFKRLCDKVGIPHGDTLLNDKGERIGIVFHCLRHTRTTKWVEMGFSDEIVRRATGHKSLDAYQQYVKLNAGSVMLLVKEGKGRVENGMTASVNSRH